MDASAACCSANGTDTTGVKQRQPHRRNQYRRVDETVEKRLKWLMLTEATYGKVDVNGEGVDPSTHRKYELVQRTTHKGAANKKKKKKDGQAQDGSDDNGDDDPPQHISAVDICCILHKKQHCQKKTHCTRRFLVLVSQYRPALNAFSLELPAGLYDAEDGDAYAAAARELFEETGYAVPLTTGTNANTAPSSCSSSSSPSSYGPLSYDCGISDDLFQLVHFDLHIDETVTSEEEEALLLDPETRRINAINRNPVPHLDETEDCETHLLALTADEHDDDSTPSSVKVSLFQRLEALRRSIDRRCIVDGKLQSLVMGMVMADKWRSRNE